MANRILSLRAGLDGTPIPVGEEYEVVQESTDLGTDVEPVQPVRVIENARLWRGYAGANNTLYDKYVQQSTVQNFYVIPVKAGKMYTIVPCNDYYYYFGATYSFDALPEGATRTDLLYKLTVSDNVWFESRYVHKLADRQKMHYTPAADGFIVGSWFQSTGALVYEGASPNKGWEAYLNYPNDDFASNSNSPLNSVNNAKVNPENFLHGIKPNDKIKRLIRLGDYYKDIICSSFQLVCIGDSITFGGSVGIGNRYHDFLKAKLGINTTIWSQNGAAVTNGYGMDWTNGNVANYGKGVDGLIGFRFQENLDWTDGSYSFYKSTTEHKVFTIALGTNDFGESAPIGSYSDSTETASFYGCYKKLIAKIREMYPDSAIILICPWQQVNNGVAWDEPNSAGHTLKAYNLAIHEIAMMTRNAWVIDMLNNPYITEMANSESGVYADNVHIGRKAHILVAHELEKMLMQVVVMNGYDYVYLETYDDTFTGQK